MYLLLHLITGLRKPDPQSYLNACAELNRDPTDCVSIFFFGTFILQKKKKGVFLKAQVNTNLRAHHFTLALT